MVLLLPFKTGFSISFCSLTILAEASSTTRHESGKSRPSGLFTDPSGKSFNFSPITVLGTGFS